MKFYKDPDTNEVFAFEDDGSQDDFIPENLVAITEAEADELRAPPPAPPQTQFTSLEFLDKFTEEEQLAVVSATLANPVVKLWYDKMLAASFVDIEDPRTTSGLDALVAAGLLTSERRTVILGG